MRRAPSAPRDVSNANDLQSAAGRKCYWRETGDLCALTRSREEHEAFNASAIALQRAAYEVDQR